jgi:hypothetical protein
MPNLRCLAATLALSASSLPAQTCVAHVDTVRDTIYAVLQTVAALTPTALTPVVRTLVTNANGPGSIGAISMGAGPTGPVLDLRIGTTRHALPATFTVLPGAWVFTLHRDGTVTRAHAVATPGPVGNLFNGGTIPYPDGATTDSLVLHLGFRLGADPALASAPYAVRRIYVLPIEQQAHALATNPRPTYPRGVSAATDTVMVQFAVTADGDVDPTSFYPIRAHSQASLDAVRAALPALRFAPALGVNNCPARTVLSQSFVVRASTAR